MPEDADKALEILEQGDPPGTGTMPSPWVYSPGVTRSATCVVDCGPKPGRLPKHAHAAIRAGSDDAMAAGYGDLSSL